MISKLGFFKQPAAYAAIGLVNTGITAALIFSLMASGVSALAANAVGYGAGLICSYFLNSRLTFKVDAGAASLVRFLLAAGVAYLANLLVVILTIKVTDAPHIAQIAGMPVYTVVGYFLNKYWAMRS